MCFGRQMYYEVRLCGLEDLGDGGIVADIDLDQAETL